MFHKKSLKFVLDLKKRVLIRKVFKLKTSFKYLEKNSQNFHKLLNFFQKIAKKILLLLRNFFKLLF